MTSKELILILEKLDVVIRLLSLSYGNSSQGTQKSKIVLLDSLGVPKKDIALALGTTEGTVAKEISSAKGKET